jgi:filamentous hemagglutinin family protein
MRTKLGPSSMSLMTSVAVVLGATPSIAQSLPTNGSVAAGSASIVTASGTSLLVNQTSQNAIINWGSFSIDRGNTVSFNNGSGSTLNRVTGNVPSHIDGTLSATGSVYLVNPAGVAVGSDGNVATGGSFVASTLNITDSNFLAGGDMTFSGGSKASIVNAGKIGSLGGDVALIARAVDNAGSITAPNGTAALVAGYEVLVRDGDLDGGKFQVKVGGADTEVKTRGKIQASTAELRANGGNVYALAGNTDGIIAAKGTATKGGRVFLTAGDGGTVEAGGTITASRTAANGSRARGGDIRVSGGTAKVTGKLSAKGSGADGQGGTVVVTGTAITLGEAAVVNASGATGGVILIGGDFQGGKDAATKLLSETVATASTTRVAAGAQIIADGTAGDGGRVVIWSNDYTTFGGSISARGTGAGKGGDAEVSGKAVLDFRGTVDLSAENGTKGTLLLDPYNLTIYDGASGGATSTPNVSPTGEDAYLNVATLQSALENANVSVSTSGSDGTGAEEGNIVVAAAVSWGASTTLTLSAAGNVIFNAAVTATGESAGLIVQYGSGKDYTVNAPITLSGSSATLQIGAAGSLQTYTLVHSMADLDAITGLSGKYALAQSLDASGTVYTNALITGSFTGIFAGLGNSISNLTIAAPTVDNVGLFANADYGSTVRDLSLVDGSVTGKGSVGALAGIAAGRVSNVSSSVSVVGSGNFVGGIAGLNSGGGAGIWDSSSSGSVRGVDYVGGIAGNSQASITRSYATGAVNGQNYVGGLAGITGDTVSETYATGAVTATGNYVGGLVGLNGTAVQNSYATGSVKGASETGGLVGSNFGLVGTSYALGSVTGTVNVGGLVGTNQDATIDTSYASGAVTGTSNVGGLVGSNTTWASVASSYWDTETTGQAHSAGSSDSFGLTTAQARDAASYAGWDFSAVWYQDGGMRPIGRWEAAPSVNGVVSISNAHQLQLVNANPGGSYTLSSNIDASATSGANAAGIWSSAGFVPIGSNSSPFTGKFDGQGHVVSNLSIQRASTDQVGLFGTINAAVISNIGLVGGSITGQAEVGGLIGHDDGSTVSASYSTADVAGETSVGGLVGYTSSATYVSLYATGDVTATGSAGGLIGYAGGTAIDKSYASGAVSGRGAVGGLAGTLKNSDDGSHVGTVARSYATGNVSADDNPSSGETVGGLVGSLQDGSISESYSTGSVTLNASSSDGNDYLVGGLVGDNFYGNIQHAYSTGQVVSSACAAVNCVAGGFAGRSDSGTISASYWDTNTSGMAVGIGSDPSSNAVAPFTTAAAFNESTYSGFDFASTWYLIPNETRPFLRSEWSATIVNAHQLQLMTLNLGAAYTLGANIDLSATAQASQMWNTVSGFSPIGDMSNAFSGSLDGTGHTLSNLFIDRSAIPNSYAGLFGNTGGTSVIRNVGLVSGDVTGSDVSTGSLVGSNAGTLENVFSNVGVTGNNGVGGLVGTNSGLISVASATGSVTLTGAGPLFGGGLVGINTGSIKDAFAIGGVSGGDVIGALVGYNTGSIDRTYASGNVSGTGTIAGALVGTNDGSIAASYWLMGTTPGVSSGSGTVTTSGDLSVAEFQDTGFFVTTASAAGWNFDTTWAPPSSGYLPDLYALTPIVWVKGVSTTSTYGDSIATITSATSVGGPSRYVFGPAGDTITLTGRAIDVAPTTSAGTSTISINQSQSGNSVSGRTYRIFYSGDDVATVAKATLTATFAGAVTKVYNGTTAASLASNNFTLTGVVGSDDVAIASASGTYTSANAGSGIGVSVSGLTLSGTAAANYSLTTTALSDTVGTITQASLSAVLAGAVTKVYTGTTTASLASNNFTLTGVVGSDDVAIAPASGAYATADVGSGLDVSVSGLTLSGTAAANYSLSTTSLSGSIGAITQASLVVTASNASKTYGQVATLSGFSSQGLQNGETIGSVTLTSTGAAATATVAGGPYAIVASNASGGTFNASNYDISYDNGALTVDPATLTVTASNASKVYGDLATLNGSTGFTAGGLVNGDTVTTVSLSSSGTTATAGAGDYDIVAASAQGSGLDNYTITYVDGTMTVTPRALTVAADNASMTAGGAVPPLTWGITVGDLVNGDTLTGALTTPATSASAAGAYAILQGSLAASNNYALTYVPGVLTIQGNTGPTPSVIAAAIANTPNSWFVQTSAFHAGVVFHTGEDGHGAGPVTAPGTSAYHQTVTEEAFTGCTGGAAAGASCTSVPHPQNTQVGRFLRFVSPPTVSSVVP